MRTAILRDHSPNGIPSLLVGSEEREGLGFMAGWREVESNLHVSEYAKLVCRSLGWPYQGNLTLLCECITSLAHLRELDVWGGFFLLMEAVEAAKQEGIRVDRWFFQDGKYVDILEADPLPEAKPPKPEIPPIVKASKRIN